MKNQIEMQGIMSIRATSPRFGLIFPNQLKRNTVIANNRSGKVYRLVEDARPLEGWARKEYLDRKFSDFTPRARRNIDHFLRNQRLYQFTANVFSPVDENAYFSRGTRPVVLGFSPLEKKGRTPTAYKNAKYDVVNAQSWARREPALNIHA